MRLGATIALGCMLSACSLVRPHELRRCPHWVETYFFSKSAQERQNQLTSHDPDTQYEIYICGTQYMHPAVLDLVIPFASQGETAARLLRQKLSAQVISDATVRDIVQVFAAMARLQTYDVSNDESLMRLLETKVQAMRDPDSRAFANDLLEDIKQGRRPANNVPEAPE